MPFCSFRLGLLEVLLQEYCLALALATQTPRRMCGYICACLCPCVVDVCTVTVEHLCTTCYNVMCFIQSTPILNICRASDFRSVADPEIVGGDKPYDGGIGVEPTEGSRGRAPGRDSDSKAP